MHANDPTHTASPAAPTRTRVLLLVRGPFPGYEHHRAAVIAARARGADVLVVAPTLPVPGERWIIDLNAREARARANLQSWIDALVDQAESIRGEIGDESPRLALADALDGFAADEYLDTLGPADPARAHRRSLAWLRELLAPAPRAPRLRAGHS